MRTLMALVLGGAVALAAPGIASAQDVCGSVASLASLPGTTIVSAKAVPANAQLSTIAYFDAVKEKVPAAKDSVRLFLAPGVLHCGGGAGPDRFDALTAMEQWVEHGTPPASMIATKANQPLSRPLCPYPQLAQYKGAGDPNDAASFACAAP